MKTDLLFHLLKEQRVNINNLAKSIEMTHTGLTKALNNNTLRVDTLEKIAEVLGVSPCYFFQPEGASQNQEAQVDYFRNEVLGKTTIKLDFRNYIQSQLDHTILIRLFERLEEVLEKNIKATIMEACGLKNQVLKYSEIEGSHFQIIRQAFIYAKQTNNISLKGIIDDGYRNAYLNFSIRVAEQNAVVKFLREEKFISDLDLVLEIEQAILQKFNFTTNESIGFLDLLYNQKTVMEATSIVEMLRKGYN